MPRRRPGDGPPKTCKRAEAARKRNATGDLRRGRTKCSKEQVVEALEKSKGLMYIACKQLNIAFQTLGSYVDKWNLRPLIDELRGRRVDDAELKLDRAVRQGEDWAVKYTLSTLGQDRGFIPLTKKLIGQDPNNPLPQGQRVDMEKVLSRLPVEMVRALLDAMKAVQEEQKALPQPTVVQALPAPEMTAAQGVTAVENGGDEEAE